MKFRQPKNCESQKVRPKAQVTTGYLRYLAETGRNRYYYFIGGRLLLQLA